MMTLTEMPKYDAYKDSRVEWFGTIPESWCVKKLSHLFSNIGSGTTPATGNINFYNGNIPWLQTGDLTDGIINSTTKTISERALKTHSTLKQYKVGSLVVAMYGATIGKAGLLNIRTTTNQACCVLEQTDSVDMRFAFYLFMGFKSNIVAMGYGGGQPNISQDLIRNLRFPFPHKQLQTAIANFLDEKTAKIDDAIAIKERQIALLNERKQILIQQAVAQGLDPNVPMKDSGVAWTGTIPAHWCIKRAKYLFDEINERSINGDEELLSVSHITGVTPRSEKNVNMFMAEDYSGSKTCKKNDLVINIMWAWMGALGVSDREGIVSPSYGVFREKIKNTFNPVFLEHLLKSKSYIEHYNQVSTGLHSSRLRFYGHMFFDMEMGFPSFEEQNRIIEYVRKESKNIDKALLLQEQQITLLKEYKSTLINSAVTGKIKVI